MKRRVFFKNLTAAIIGVVVAPVVVTEAAERTIGQVTEQTPGTNYGLHSRSRTVTAVGDSTGGESAGAWIVVYISNTHYDCPRIGFNLYYKDKYNIIHPLMITEVGLRPGFNSVARLILRPLSADLVIGKGAIKDGTTMCVGSSHFGDRWKLDAAHKQPYNNEPFDISDFDRVIPVK